MSLNIDLQLSALNIYKTTDMKYNLTFWVFFVKVVLSRKNWTLNSKGLNQV